MLTALIRLYLATTTPHLTTDAAHETAHRACAEAVYAVLAPHAGDHDIDHTAEAATDVLCVEDPGQWDPATWRAIRRLAGR